METVLRKEVKFVSDDGKLLKNSIIEAGLRLDPSLLKLLVENETIKGVFFAEVDSTLVFDKFEFQKFVSNKQFLEDSYTSFKNKIGLSDGEDGYLKQRNDVVLNWAYKDCVLEGGMTKKDKGRKEIFYNTTLAPDEITRLYAPKVFTNFEKWDAAAVKGGKAKKVTEIKSTDNLLIKGNNLLALHCLKERYAGKVKLIYIDPPYNTGKVGDSFAYNNSFSHSTWLTFMKNRLEVAKLLLKKDGIIVIDIDHNELFYLGVMCDEIFGVENRLGVLSVQHNPGGRDAEFFAVSNENKIIYAANKELAELYGLPLTKDDIKKFTKEDNISKYKLTGLIRTGDNSRKEDRENMYFPIFYNKETKDISVYPMTGQPWIEMFPIDNQGIRRIWRWGKETVQEKWRSEIVVTENRGKYQIKVKDRLTPNRRKNSKTLWLDSKYAGTRGTTAVKEIFGEKIFTYPKSPFQVADVLELTTREGDLILDFFGGSGTTFDVAHKMGRQWIGVEQINYEKDLPESRIKEVINGDQTGISKNVNWIGGGEFIYCELKEWNEKYIQEARKVKTKADIKKLYRVIKQEAFYRYDVDMKAFDTEDFDALSLGDQKKALCVCLDVNHLYVNYSERDDARYKVTDEERELTRKVYGK